MPFILLMLLLSGCASRDLPLPAPAHKPAPPSIEHLSTDISIVAFETAQLHAVYSIRNPGSVPLRINGYRYTLETGAQGARQSDQEAPGLSIPAEDQKNFELTLQLPLGKPLSADASAEGKSKLDYTLALEARVSTGSVESQVLRTSIKGRVDRPRLPKVSVPEVIIRQFETKIIRLEYIVEVYNPNPFTLHYTPQPHQFSFAGKLQAEERVPEQFRLAAGERKRVAMPLQINYLQAGRRTVDILIADKTMHYTLFGQAEARPAGGKQAYRFSFQDTGSATLIRP